jgi:hypothetical protein
MTSTWLPIAGFPHLFLDAQDDGPLQARTLAHLRKAGFRIESTKLIPPDVSDGPAVIRAITVAFEHAKSG